MENLHPLTETEWPALHQLMLARKFPNVPPRFAEAQTHLRRAKAFGVGSATHITAAFVFGPPEDGVAFFDAVCTKTAQGRWATRQVLRALFTQAFAPAPLGFGLRCLWVKPHGAQALKAALAVGFQPVTPLKGTAAPILVITPHTVPISLQPNLKG